MQAKGFVNSKEIEIIDASWADDKFVSFEFHIALQKIERASRAQNNSLFIAHVNKQTSPPSDGTDYQAFNSFV